MRMLKKKLRINKEDLPFWSFWTGMAVYYGYRLFAIGPWYDELYTYSTFISRGPLYAAIHWPLPNNHVFYSVLSGFLDWLGNPYIGLRGISWLASLGTLIVLYRFCGRYLSRALSLAAVCLFASMELVNGLSVQGRGYALTVFLYVCALWQLSVICLDTPKKRHYILFCLCLAGALYTIASCTFWVIPVCLTGGFYLLCHKDWKRLKKLIASALAAALLTFCLYLLIWLAIGSNLLVKDAQSLYYGMGHVQVILKAPFAAAAAGASYMLQTPYIQSVGLLNAWNGFYGWMSGVLENLLTGSHLFFFCLSGFGLILLAVSLYLAARRRQPVRFFFALYLSVSIVMLPVMILLQATLPYNRVFSYFGVVLAVLTVYVLALLLPGETYAEPMRQTEERAVQDIGDPGSLRRKKNPAPWIAAAVLALFAVWRLGSPYYNRPLGERENAIAEAFSTAASELAEIEGNSGSPAQVLREKKFFLADDYQQYVLKFYWDVDAQSVPAGEAEIALIPRTETDPARETMDWPDLYTFDSLPWDELADMVQVYRNDWYVLYIRK